MTRAEETLKTQKRYDRGAALYDLRELPMELLGFGRLRRELWSDVTGAAVLEIGAGTGKNFPYHPPGAAVVALDLSPRMLRRAQRRAARLGKRIDLVLADAQALPFRDGAFDAAAATFVFCSVPDPVLGLREAARVLKEGGEVHLLEHVRAANPVAGKVMDILNPVSLALQGANINRDTVGNVARAGIVLDEVRSHLFGIVKVIRGSGPRRVTSGEKEVAEGVAHL